MIGLSQQPSAGVGRNTLKGASVGGGAVAIAMVAIGFKAAADVRTGHITNTPPAMSPTGPPKSAPEAAPRAMSFTRSPASAETGRKIAVAMIAVAKKFFMIEPPLRAGGRTKSKFPSVTPTGSTCKLPMSSDPTKNCFQGVGLAQLAQFGIEKGSQFVAATLIDQDVERLRGADLGV